MINWVGLWTLTNREVGRFFSVYRQTVIPGLISSILYILIFGFTLEQRISEIQGVSYTMFILPGLIMMNTLTNASSNTSSSMLQMKLLQQLPDLLTAPLSGLEIALAYIIGGTVRGMGLVMGQLAESWDQLAMIQNFFLTPLSFLGGIFYSITMLPEWAQNLSYVNPIYYMINGIRYTILETSDSPVSISFWMAILLTLLFTSAAIIMMQSGKRIKQ